MAPADVRLRVGVDIVGVKRLEAVVGNDPARQKAVFTPTELEYCHRKRRAFDHLAARFAAKEAVLKAFGTGVSQRMRWTDVEVVNDRRGRPLVRLDGAVARFAERHGLRSIDVSLSHTNELALAHVLTVWAGAD